jgi:dTDP-glucose pyrophosphorylase
MEGSRISVIIPAAGKATRMKPLSSNMSKAMVPVNGIPIIRIILDRLAEVPDVQEVVVVQNGLRDIEEFLADQHFPFEVKFVEQVDPRGPLHAVEIGARRTQPGNRVLLWLGDTICLERDLPFEESFLAVSQVSDKSRWCLVDEENNFYDKPDGDVPTDLALIGVYYFHDGPAFDLALQKGMLAPKIKGEHQISALLESYRDRVRFRLVRTAEWYDCGELNTYYESRARLMRRGSREFNRIEVDTFMNVVTKNASGNKALKVEAEKTWFSSLSDEQRLFVPQLLDSEHGTMRMSWESGTPLNEVWLYDKMKSDQWTMVMDKVLRVYHEIFVSEEELRGPERARFAGECYEMYVNKNLLRVAECRDFYGEDYELVEDFVFRTGCAALCSARYSRVIHGDLHLGNILFDPFTGRIKLLDPRGVWGKAVGSHGDPQYDMAKVLHDWYVGYMMMTSGRMRTREDFEAWDGGGPQRDILSFLDGRLESLGYDVALIKRMSVALVLTCLPFHADSRERQRAFVNRAVGIVKDNGL